MSRLNNLKREVLLIQDMQYHVDILNLTRSFYIVLLKKSIQTEAQSILFNKENAKAYANVTALSLPYIYAVKPV